MLSVLLGGMLRQLYRDRVLCVLGLKLIKLVNVRPRPGGLQVMM